MSWAKQKEKEQLDIYSVPTGVRKLHPGKTAAEITRENRLSKLPHVVTVPNPDRVQYVPPVPTTTGSLSSLPTSFKWGITSSKINLIKNPTIFQSTIFQSIIQQKFHTKISVLKNRSIQPSSTLVKWCKKNCIGKFMHWENDKWKFELEEDAAHFKMVWG